MRELRTTSAQRLETIGRLQYFSGWNDAQRHALATASKIISLAKGKPLVSKGQPLGGLHVLISGELRVFIPLPGDQERVVGILGPGQSFGEGSLALGIASPYSAIATQVSHVLIADADVYRRELHKSTKLLTGALNLCAQRLIHLMNDLEVCAQRTSIQRVACFFSQYQPGAESANYSVPLAGRKMDIATRLGLTPETFSRVLTFLESQGLLEAKGKKVTVLDGPRLRAMTQGGCQFEAATT